MTTVTLQDIISAEERIRRLGFNTNLEHNQFLSDLTQSNVFLKREDQQPTFAYKRRGAANKILSLSQEEVSRGFWAVSAGNHSQAVAYVCNQLPDGIYGGEDAFCQIVMPANTNPAKIEATRRFGNGKVDVHLKGDTYDQAKTYAEEKFGSSGRIFIPPFDDPMIISGQGTIGLEINRQMEGKPIDYVLVPIGGGGLISGISTALAGLRPDTKVIGVEDEDAAAMCKSVQAGQIVTLKKFSSYVDGAAVGRVGDIPFAIWQKLKYDVVTVPQGEILSTAVELHERMKMVVELAGAMPITALTYLPNRKNSGYDFRGKNVVCIVSGGNVDVDKLKEIKERSLKYKKIEHDFVLELPDRPGALDELFGATLRAAPPIRYNLREIHFTEKAAVGGFVPVEFGIRLESRGDYGRLLHAFEQLGINYKEKK